MPTVEYDIRCITDPIRQSIQLGHHLKAWKRAKGVMLRKSNELDYMTAKLYCVISLLNRLDKVYEKVVAQILAEWCEINQVLHSGQMGSRRQKSTIDAVGRVVSRVQET